jgi:uncharacterized protein YdhG (YjbR/CyaY superfamily)
MVPAAKRQVLQGLRRQIAASAPQATETISYGMPAFVLDARGLVSYAAFKDHCSLFAGRGIVESFGDELEARVSGRSTLWFTADDPIPTALVRKIVRSRVRDVRAAGPGKVTVRR